MLRKWIISKIEIVKDLPRVLVRDPYQLLPRSDGTIHTFAKENGFSVIIAATNLVFRELYEQAISDPDIKKILVVDRTPLRRLTSRGASSAPPPFLPDFLDGLSRNAIIELNPRQFLMDVTGDANWPKETNDSEYARLIVKNIDGILEAHTKLRKANADRFTDSDFKSIVAFGSLGIGDLAFQTLGSSAYWRIGLLNHELFDELEQLAPEATLPIRKLLQSAPIPFSHFLADDADQAVRAFYLSVLLQQHTPNWKLMLANIDPTLSRYTTIDEGIITRDAPQLLRENRDQAEVDLDRLEEQLGRESLTFILCDQLAIQKDRRFISVLVAEQYSSLIRSLCLALALNDLLATKDISGDHKRIQELLNKESSASSRPFVESRTSKVWEQLKEAYKYATNTLFIERSLRDIVKDLGIKKSTQLSFKDFRGWWNDKKLNRLEYYTSILERIVDAQEILPKSEEHLPPIFLNVVSTIRQNARQLTTEIREQMEIVNQRYQELVAHEYPDWIRAGDGIGVQTPCLTSQFITCCLRRYWDAKTEKAVVFVFDGMRPDIWEEFLRPIVEDKMEVIADLPASSLLPTETRISRWAIAAGTLPRDFLGNMRSENIHLTEALQRELKLAETAEAIPPESSGTGETIRYRCGNLDYYIFELCDNELHGIGVKKLADGREVVTRPLAFIYQQSVKNIIDTEVASIIRRLQPGTKVFIVADHGFGPVSRNPIQIGDELLNDRNDCKYLSAKLRVPFTDESVPARVRENVISFTPDQIGMPSIEKAMNQKTKETYDKEVKAYVFPKAGNAFKRATSNFDPDAFTHGGISLQETLIPMIVLKVKPQDEGTVSLSQISGPNHAVEGEELEFKVTLNLVKSAVETEVRVGLDATYARDTERFPLSTQTAFVTKYPLECTFKFIPASQDATEEERRNGAMKRILAISMRFKEGRKIVKRSQYLEFTVILNSERIVRRVGSLGSILGLSPK